MSSRRYISSIFVGLTTSGLTVGKDFFTNHTTVLLWKFQVVYRSSSGNSSKELTVLVNQPPFNGSCSIAPRNGTTTTLFNISCKDWLDAEGIQDYLFYGKNRPIIAFLLSCMKFEQRGPMIPRSSK